MGVITQGKWCRFCLVAAVTIAVSSLFGLALSGKPARVSGVIAPGVNDTWSGAVFVTGDVFVPQGVTLTIQPGTTVTFADRKDDKNLWKGQLLDQQKFRGVPRAELLVAGTLIARGTSNKLITFTGDWSSKDANLPYGQWGGIVILPTATPTTLEYLAIMFAEVGITIDNKSAIENSYIIGSWGSLCDQPPVKNPPNHWDVRVGVFVRGSGGSAVRKNVILWNTWGIHANTGGTGKPPIAITGNWICWNSTKTKGFDVPNGIHVYATEAVITDNWISYNDWGIEVSRSIVTVTNNWFTFNDLGFVWYFDNDEAICKPSKLSGNTALCQRGDYVQVGGESPLPQWWF